MPQWFARKASLSEALPAHASSAPRMPVSVGMKSPCVHRCRWGSQAAALHPCGRAPALAPSALAPSLCCQGGHTGSHSAHSLGPWECFPPASLPPGALALCTCLRSISLSLPLSFPVLLRLSISLSVIHIFSTALPLFSPHSHPTLKKKVYS